MIQHPVPKTHLIELGEITVSFALLESTMKGLVWTLISKDQRIGQIITAEIPFKNIRSLAISLYLYRYGQNEKFILLKK